jgi:lipopolysaccharide biosynthesis glycosyltransferase
MTKVKITNHDLRVLQFLLDEGVLPEQYLSVVTDICLNEAKENLEKEMNAHLSQTEFNKRVRAEVV